MQGLPVYKQCNAYDLLNGISVHKLTQIIFDFFVIVISHKFIQYDKVDLVQKYLLTLLGLFDFCLNWNYKVFMFENLHSLYLMIKFKFCNFLFAGIKN